MLVAKSLLPSAGDLRDAGLVPVSGRSPGEGHDSPLQYSCLENGQRTEEPGGLQSIGRTESDMTEATYHSEKNETWMDLESIILCEVSQKKKDKYHMISYVESKI